MNEAEKQTASGELDEADVVDYLERNADFLRRNPQAIEAMELQHASGNAVSLIERQVDSLRATNRELRSRFDALIETARENQQRVVHLNRLARILVSAESAAGMTADLAACMVNHLDVDRIYIGVNARDLPPDSGIHTLVDDDAASRALTNVFRRGKPICGALSVEQSEALFATRSESAAPLVSAALVPLGVNGVHGALVLASHQAARFVPEMGTLFLELAGELVTAALRRLLGADVLSGQKTDPGR